MPNKSNFVIVPLLTTDDLVHESMGDKPGEVYSRECSESGTVPTSSLSPDQVALVRQGKARMTRKKPDLDFMDKKHLW
ncbi:MAG: hypothetical protein A2431_00645 [Candidatus Zambryskibacteria bacterium RIFOXYC1_FULL_39_10]|uniref:Uncharacterized protein n=1 Tax=Candidatus Zambryskibacteria bacterium RIFOXYC1_FULL_39_10 TaxID=1802779 RepID=A0A1G2V211_9BACT|nr:MAG: hypothetical protein A2431_00645 [Candidatus Zambryskibacteria bacterium RIFOXYC1_FULL_39_10]OHB16553.1 MAG: hypothetical protein A2605_03640 [Candidatus Zambryskibacteria bacterium RIFOXYD1_FULL_39_35]